MASGNTILPVLGKPIYSTYSYAWGGLDHNTGNPLGYLGKTRSDDYNTIVNNTIPDSLIYNGPSQPPFFGAIMNTFSWKKFSLSINISYKFGYFFRRSSINYGSLFSSWTGSSDYALRWQKPGDESHTTVPSMVYPTVSNRDLFYSYSDILVERADNIRLEDIRLDYRLDNSQWHSFPFKQITFYVLASNLGVIWIANKQGIDPYYNNTPKNSKMVAFGLNINF